MCFAFIVVDICEAVENGLVDLVCKVVIFFSFVKRRTYSIPVLQTNYIPTEWNKISNNRCNFLI
jgi:hypothetical protein